jgi:two-component system response regulator AtoC
MIATDASPLHILVVDDEPDLANVIRYNLTRRGHQVQIADSGESAEDLLSREATPDIIVSDVMMPGMNGFELCRRIRAAPRTAQIPLLLLTARAAPADKHEGFIAGCDDYLSKPFDMQELMLRVEALGRRLWWARQAAARVGDRAKDSRALPAMRPTPTSLMEKLSLYERRFPGLRAFRSDVMRGSSARMMQLFEDVLIQAHTQDPVLVVGETGTGKTLVAEALWRLGPRADKPFRTINCAELQAADPLVVMGRLFGLGRDSGLHNVPREGHAGILEECHGGTLFLDEVALLPSPAQALLLLPAEGRAFNPAAGRGDPVSVDVKLIFATNRDLAAEARAGRFPVDLMMRIGQATIAIPPLRDRPDDVRELSAHFVAEAGADLGHPALRATDSLLDEVCRRPWPGNVRELRASLRDAARRAAFRDCKEVAPEHLPLPAAGAPTNPPPPWAPERRVAEAVTTSPPAYAGGDEAIEFTPGELHELSVLRRNRFQIGPSEAELGLSQKSRTLTNHLRGFCFKALAKTHFNVEQAALAVVGRAEDALVDRMQNRIHHYLVTVRENVATGSEDRLYNNLPRDYHRAMEDAVGRARAGTLPVPASALPRVVEDDV